MLMKLCVKAQNLVNRLTRKEEGATMVEYAIMVALIAIVSIGIITLLGTSISAAFFKVDASMDKV